ncbi:ImmA/IrrE family metallo-endopeptidase [Anaerococcus sp. Marseille-P3625]|uniref:ImmA/IrrE family metallo-endopeptidase n=1 Tax=Anaerococcus sp. Marseille-P3625 TaxID=1977277 RepID=UPI000C078520|nr:ImmA/IrrE family metallo-endopeptidase [Anaerococcus sp. Marseille-P3625]
MSVLYDQIFLDTKKIIKKYKTRDPREILEAKGVFLIPFKSPTKVLGMYKIIKKNRFVFYNPHLSDPLLNMVLAHELGHDIYHKDELSYQMAEYELFDIRTDMEIEANIFAAHLLINEETLLEDLKLGYTYNQLASLYEVNANLMIFKLNEMHRMGMPIRQNEADPKFFAQIDGNIEEDYYNY